MNPQETNEFFAQLPPDVLTEKEKVLTDALRAFLDSWTSEAPPTLSDACSVPLVEGDARSGSRGSSSDVRAAKQALLPPGITLGRWIRERLGNELETEMTEWNVEYFQRVGLLDMTKVKRPEKKETQASVDFFASLPEGSFTPDEEKLRQAILEFLDNWHHPHPPSVSDACKRDPNSQAASSPIAAAKRRALPNGVKLHQWMERRIGGEIEVARSSVGICHFHRHGELDIGVLPAKLG